MRRVLQAAANLFNLFNLFKFTCSCPTPNLHRSVTPCERVLRRRQHLRLQRRHRRDHCLYACQPSSVTTICLRQRRHLRASQSGMAVRSPPVGFRQGAARRLTKSRSCGCPPLPSWRPPCKGLAASKRPEGPSARAGRRRHRRRLGNASWPTPGPRRTAPCGPGPHGSQARPRAAPALCLRHGPPVVVRGRCLPV